MEIETTQVYPIGIKQAITYFSDDNFKKDLKIDQYLINSFLKVVEIMKEEITIKLIYEHNTPFYIVSKKR